MVLVINKISKKASRFTLLYLFALFCLLVLPARLAQSQTDKEFWFVAPEITENHDFPGGYPIKFVFTTTDLPANVTIEMPKNPAFIPINVAIAANSTAVVDPLGPPYNELLSNIENKFDNYRGAPLATTGGVGNKGIHITSDNLVTCYYESSSKTGNNPDYYSLKGNNALGTAFYTSFQTKMLNVNNDIAQRDSAMAAIVWVNNAANGYNFFTGAGNTLTVRKTTAVNKQSAESPLGNVKIGDGFTVTVSAYTRTSGNIPTMCIVDAARNPISNTVPVGNNGTFYLTCPGGAANPAYLEVFNNIADNVNITFRASISKRTPDRNGWANPAYSAFDVVFAEDNTFLTLVIPAGKAIYSGTATPFTGTVTLGPFHRGETYSGIPAKTNPPELKPTQTWNPGGGATAIPISVPLWKNSDLYFGRSATDHLSGVKVTTNGKKIAITVKDDSMKSIVSTCYDLAGDQTIPIALTGTEYIVLKGRGSVGALGPWYKATWNGGGTQYQESIFILATQNNTDIFIDGVLKATKNAGETFTWDVVNNITLVTSTAGKPVYCLQISGWGCEMGEAILPTTSVCTGSTQVGFSRSVSDPCFLNIMVRKKAKGGFLLNGAYNALLDSTVFTDIPNSEWAAALIGDPVLGISLATIPVGTATRISNTKDVFHVGVINGSQFGGARFGYFSDYNPLTVSAFITETGSSDIRLCYGQSAQIVARGGIFYKWQPTDYLSDPLSPIPIASPPHTISYVATVSGACDQFDSTVIGIAVAPPFKLNFNIDTTFGCAPLKVTIHDQSSNILKYFWDFGDGVKASWITNADITNDTTFSHTYANPTRPLITRKLRLIVENKYQCRDTMDRPIIIYPQVTNGFIMTPDTVSCHPLAATFTNASKNTDYFQWEFGDGGSSSDSLASHIFNNFSQRDTIYKATLTSRSIYGCSVTARQNVLVHPYFKADFTLSPAEGCSPYNAVMTNNSLGGKAIKTAVWDFGDGSPALSTTFKTVTHLFTNNTDSIQVRRIRLVITNVGGCTDSMIRLITIYPVVHAQFTQDKVDGCNPVTVKYTKPGNNIVPVLYTWDFGDGASSSASDPTHIFSNTNSLGHDTTYTTRLVVTSQYLCRDTSKTTVKVYPLIDANFSIDKSEACAPFDLTITNNSLVYKGISKFLWDYGDGQKDSTATLSHTHHYINNTNGTLLRNIRLIVRNTGGCRDTMIVPVNVFPKITSGFNIRPDSSGCEPLSVRFNNTSNHDVASIFHWDFGDGVSSNQDSTTHTYYNVSNQDTVFKARLIALSDKLCADTHTTDIHVWARIHADFTIDKAQSCSPFPVLLTNNSTGGITTYTWNFDDTSPVSSLVTPPHTYINQTLATQFRNLRLVVKNSHACYDTMIRQVTVYPEVVAVFQPKDTAGCNPFTLKYRNRSNSVAASFSWDLGDRGSSSDINPLHTYTNLGPVDSIYAVHMHAVSAHGCFADFSGTVKTDAYINADFKVDNADICSDMEVVLHNTSQGGVTLNSWDFESDGIIDNFNSATDFTHPYLNVTKDPVIKNLMLIVKNSHLCPDTLVRPVTVYPKVIAAFDYDSAGCHPFTDSFTNKTLGGNFLLGSLGNYDWYFGDGGTSGLQDPVKIFNNYTDADIAYPVKLVSTSQYSCKDSITKTVHIYHKPKAKFSIDHSIDCSPFALSFSNISVTTGSSYAWNFGDGSTDTTYNKNSVNHPFSNPNTSIANFPVSMTAYTPHGCSDQAVITVSVYPEVAADFSYDHAGCSPYTSQFVNQSSNASYYNWDFDDGKISMKENPSNRFLNEGATDQLFQVRLIAKSQYDCLDTVVKQVTVYGQPLAEFEASPALQVFFPNPVVSINNQTNNQPSWNYQWTFGDLTTGTNNEAIFNKTYTAWGPNSDDNRFYITLKAINSLHIECSNIVTHEIRIRPPKPEIAIVNNNPQGCEPYTVKLALDYSYIYEDSIFWDFDDGTYAREKEPVHSFQQAGIYNVKVTVIGDGGTSFAYKTVDVYARPVANFEINPKVAFLPDDVVNTFNRSQGDVAWAWDFGDGSTSSEKEPNHLYTKLGKYDVRLIVTSEHGCLDTLLRVSVISVEGAAKLEFPNAFTPKVDGPTDGHYKNLTGDDVNDIFYPVHDGIAEYHLEIYSRWGELLFQTDDIWEGWNGYYKEKLCKQDVYVWKAKGKFWNGKDFMKAGDVTLLQKKD